MSEPERATKYAQPQDCTCDVQHVFYGGGARIVRFEDERKQATSCMQGEEENERKENRREV